jgi:3-hydroxy-D-aspartate aldolase
LDLAELDTPALVVDLDIMERNIKRMHDFTEKCGVELRPHVKTHKSPDIAKLQVEAGSKGVCLQKVSEVEVFADNGLKDIFLTNEVVVPQKLERLARIASRIHVGLAVDDAKVVKTIGRIFHDNGEEIDIYVDVDSGMHRTGVKPVDAGPLAKQISRQEGLVFKGIMAYEGHVHGTKKERLDLSNKAMAIVGQAEKAIQKAGLKSEVISVGSSVSTWTNAKNPLTTEVQPGMYVFNDAGLVHNGVATWDDCALKVYATVMSKPDEGRAVVDSGSKCYNFDKAQFPETRHPGVKMYNFSEEHGWLKLSGDGKKVKIGDRLTFIPVHCCTTVNQHDQIYGVRKGKVERVFKTAARGKMT